MKVKLLKKVRRKIRIINGANEIANPTDKFCRVVIGSGNDMNILKTSRKKDFYINYGNALNRRRDAILSYARSYQKKKWYVFS